MISKTFLISTVRIFQPFLTLSQTTNLDSFELTVFADDYFEFHVNGGQLSKLVENTVGKGEIARYEQFLLFP